MISLKWVCLNQSNLKDWFFFRIFQLNIFYEHKWTLRSVSKVSVPLSGLWKCQSTRDSRGPETKRLACKYVGWHVHKLNKGPSEIFFTFVFALFYQGNIYKNPGGILPPPTNVTQMIRCKCVRCVLLCVNVTSPPMNGLQVKAGTQEKDPVTSPLTITTENVTSATTTQVTKVTLQMIPADIKLVLPCFFILTTNAWHNN